MEVKYQGHEKRKQEARELWIAIATDLNAGMDIETVRLRHPNKKTGKPYHRTHIYWILRQIRTTPIN
jgi:hypothetical protein